MADNREDTANLPTDSKTYLIYAIVGSLVPLTLIVVASRFYSRHVLTRTLGIDDWMTLVSTILYLITCFLMLEEAQTGLGQHKWTLTAEQLVYYYKIFYVDIIFYISALGFIKLHILLQYLRIFAIKMRKITIWVMVLVSLMSFAILMTCIFLCSPIAGFWDKSLNPVCLPLLPQWYSNAVGNIVTDIVIFALPIKVLWGLNLPQSQRLLLVGVFCIGFFTVIISVVRISFLDIGEDDTYNNVNSASWTVGEMSSAIIASCLPCLRPLLTKMFPRLHSSSGNGGHGSHTIQTIGGGFTGHHQGSSRLTDSSHQRTRSHLGRPRIGGDAASGSLRGSSTDELTKPEGVEMKGVVAKSTTDLATAIYVENMSKDGHEAYDNLAKSPAQSMEALRGAGGRSPAAIIVPGRRDELLGLRSGTLTTIQASSRESRPALPDGDGDVVGIQIKRDVVQRSGPAFH